jgi:hypothetical protein
MVNDVGYRARADTKAMVNMPTTVPKRAKPCAVSPALRVHVDRIQVNAAAERRTMASALSAMRAFWCSYPVISTPE